MLARPLALSLGDPAGIGPEIVARAWQSLRHDGPPFFVIGDARLVEHSEIAVAQIDGPHQVNAVFGSALPFLNRPVTVVPQLGRAEPANAPSIIAWIEEAVDLTLGGFASGVVTCPIAKAPLYQAGFRFPGHTEFIADLTASAAVKGTRGPVMMLTAADLRVCLVTIHVPLADVPGLITSERLCRTARITHEALQRDFGIREPRLALAGLNPHAGEDGTIGTEERDVMLPAVAQLRTEGIDITAPLPADTLFHSEARARYDAAICLYHDQGLIPVKTLDFWGGVNATLGLPIIRTSPDHGVGFDIAGKGVARPDSLVAAIRLASDMAQNRAQT
ncbi:MAG: 4-hydroxythreonine-4-phosphate dehydrogenase PdxA [Caulobacterales bacterium]|nr:4-hydroxythreonine-4-phosphate dehydrogenase PdxA [Caulobacterales bacterium]